jgi:hypothetical protein
MSAWGEMTRKYRVQQYVPYVKLWVFLPYGEFRCLLYTHAFISRIPGNPVCRILRYEADRPARIVGVTRSQTVLIATAKRIAV